MDKIKHRAVIELFVKKALTQTEIHNKMINVLAGAGPSKTMVFK